ncbi:MAG: hypothetical protein IPI85_14370 [Dehalococcoidia bacterium]|nr:hypothetical protein [Dehalococcoidia bacterium]
MPRAARPPGRPGSNGPGGTEAVYFVNNPVSRRSVSPRRAANSACGPKRTVVPLEQQDRPGIFRLYEEQIGTITPMVGDRLVEAEDTILAEWIEQAFPGGRRTEHAQLALH